MGVILGKNSRPIVFLSNAFSLQSRQKSVYVRELMAIVFVVHKWSHYLIGRKFVIKIDQRSLQFLTYQRVKTPEQHKWISKLIGFSFEIHYYLGTSNKVADALFRKEQEVELSALTTVRFFYYDDLASEVQKDSKLQVIIQDLIFYSNSHPHYKLCNGCLLYKNMLVLPKTSKFIPKLLDFHCSPSGGHSGFFGTYKKVTSIVFWEGIRKGVQSFVKACTICQVNKHSSLKSAGLLQPLPIPIQVFEKLSMDFIRGLPKAKGHDTILVLVDRRIKYNPSILLSHPYSAKDVADVFIKETGKLHGFPFYFV